MNIWSDLVNIWLKLISINHEGRTDKRTGGRADGRTDGRADGWVVHEACRDGAQSLASAIIEAARFGELHIFEMTPKLGGALRDF